MVYDLIIIGAGPAGISAGIYAARSGIKTLLLTEDFGGQMTEKAVPIENYPGFKKISGQDLISRFMDHLKQFDVEIKQEGVKTVEKKENRFLVFSENDIQYEAHSLIIATGAKHKKLNVKGEDEFVGKGLSYCVTCDGPLFQDKAVAVIGGGNSGFEAALALSDFASKISILEYGKNVAADKVNQEKVEKIEKIEVITNAALNEIKGKDFVEGLVYKDRISKETKEITVDGVFVEIGVYPVSAFLKDLVQLNDRNEVVVDAKTTKTSIPGLFCPGDVSDILYKQIVIACGEGAKAALSAYQYLKQENGES